ncbi:hypothetical protein N9O69_05275 [Alphaproteobacteria bacterium]|nr:hypothetical protein [Alphaproteobacteria bacterium]
MFRIFLLFIFLSMKMIGFSYASSSTYLCNLDQDYSVERHNLVEKDKEYIIHEFGINLPDKFMLKKLKSILQSHIRKLFKNIVVIKFIIAINQDVQNNIYNE